MFPVQISAGLLVALVVVVFIVANSIKILPEYERGVVFRLGRLRPWTTARDLLPHPIADRMIRISLRTVVHDVPPQDIITRTTSR
jgi:regulator of protease activity HflC (stomatin/prohibitin superfamily)